MLTDDKRERGPYASGLARREAILKATVDLLAEVGFHGMSLRDVARKVGISHPGVIYHFPSKEALLMAVVEQYEEEAGIRISSLAEMESVEAFESVFHMLANMHDYPMVVEMECMLVTEASSELHPAHEHFVERNAQIRQVFTKAWDHLKATGKVTPEEDGRELAQSFLAMWHGLMAVWLYDRTLNVVDILARYVLSHFTPEAQVEIGERFRAGGWIA